MGRPSGGFQFTYGVVEALVYIPPSASSAIANWPAVWTDGQDWPADGEDDILEGLGGSACFHFHYSLKSPRSRVRGQPRMIAARAVQQSSRETKFGHFQRPINRIPRGKRGISRTRKCPKT